MIDLTNIIEAAVALLVALVSAFLIPWIRSRLNASQTAELLRWVKIAVYSAQQLYYNLDGATRLEHALEVLAAKGFDVDDAALLDAVEAEVLKLHQGLVKSDDC